MSTDLLLIYAGTAFAISILFFPVLIKLLKQWKLFDSTGSHKIHQNYIPSMGGVCILLGVGFSLLIAYPLSEWSRLKFFFIALVLMFITGLRDDILTLKPRQKLISQLLPIVLLVIFGDTALVSFYGPFPSLEFPAWLSWGLTIFTIIILTNAYNLIDGLDGLAGAVGLIALLCFGFWFYLVGNSHLSLISFAFAGSITAFLFFNWEPSRIFMGDTGALTIGLLLSYLAIQFINTNHHLQETNPFKFQGSIATAVCVLIIPVFDTLRVIIVRLRRLQSPLRADKNHLHHQLVNLGFSHARSVALIVALNVLFIALAVILRYHSDQLILPVAIVICLIINRILKAAKRKYA